MLTISSTTKNTGKRIDVFLHEYYPTLSRSFFSKKIREGSILLNNLPTKPKTPLKENDIISFSENILQENLPILTPNTNLSIPLIFQNDHFLIINKPAGIQVHPSSKEKNITIANWLISHFPEVQAVGEDPLRPGIVHRLDKDTSGVMIIAKTQESFEKLKILFSQRKMQKEYLAFVYGTLEPPEGDIDLPIARSKSFRKQIIVRNNTPYRGKKREAYTHYLTEKTYKDTKKNPYTLIKALPKTGRMHQIRIHLSALGNPIVGDRLYKRRKYPNPSSVGRFFLHAHKLSFSFLGEVHSFSVPMPEDMKSFEKSLTLH